MEKQSLADFLEIAEPQKVEETTPLEDFLEVEKPEVKVEEEVKIPEAKEEPKIEDFVNKSTEPSLYTNLVKEFIEDGEWEDGQIEIENENGETETVLLSELSDIDSKLFKQIKAGQKALKEEELKSKYVSVEGLDETTKKLIEAKKAGADIRGLIQHDAELVHPLSGYDTEDPLTQEQLIRWNLHNKGEDPEDIDYKIQKYKKNFTLDVEASKVVKLVNDDFDAKVTATLEAQKQANQDALEAQKTFRKTISDKVKDFKLNDSLTKTIVDMSSKYDENGLTMADKAYFESKQNPELHAQIVFLLSNPKAFDEFKGVKIKNETAQETILKISRVPKQAASAGVKKEDNSVDPLEKFFKQ